MYMCMHMCVYTFFRCLYMWHVSESSVCFCQSLIAVYHHTSLSSTPLVPLDDCVQTCSLVYLLWLNISSALSPYHWPLRGCPHLQAVTEWAWCVGMGRGGPGYIQTGTSCVGQHRRWQPIWGFEEKREKMLRTGAEGRVEVKRWRKNKQEAKKETNRLQKIWLIECNWSAAF